MNILVKLAMASREYLLNNSFVSFKCFFIELVLIAFTLSLSMIVSENFSNLRGSMWQTSPREPENRHVKAAPRTPITRLNSSMNTDPPLSEKQASLESSVNFKFKIALPDGHASNIDRKHLPRELN